MEAVEQFRTSNSPNVHIASFDLTLRGNEGTSLKPEERTKLQQLLTRSQVQFEQQGLLTEIVEHHIVTANNPPVTSPPYRATPNRCKLLKDKVSQLLQHGIIEGCERAWSSPVVLVPKPDDSTRLCVDYRKLNNITRRDLYPLPRMEDILHSTGPVAYISTRDLKSGYHQVKVREADRDKTSFITLFGPRNAPATFQRLMDKFLETDWKMLTP